MKILIHGYGLLSRDRLANIAGSRMSGLTLYNSILFEDLSRQFDTAFLTGRLTDVNGGLLAKMQVSPGQQIFEYDARFPHYLEDAGKFKLELARQLYCQRVDEPCNPIFRYLVDVYLEVIDCYKPDVINVHNLNAASVIIHVAGSGRCRLPPVIATIHDTNQNQLKYVARHQYYFTKFVAISNAVFDELIAAGIESERIALIPNGLALEPFLDVEREQVCQIFQRENFVPKNAFKVLVPARRTPEKGIEYAIKAFSDFAKAVPARSCMLISGAGMANLEYEQRLRDYAAELKCENSIIFLGPITYNEMPALYAECDVSIIPSVVREGFCYSNVEAMATGGPVVITTDGGGCRDYITHKQNGILIPSKSSKAINRALLYLYQYPVAANDIRRRAVSTACRYTAKRMVSSYVNLIEKILRLEKVA